ncbi:MAG TPA: hypothetical protein DEA08_28645, partial [Planctomycetes bacterium]|nr:hypothetical protein [Planctomycetota bacterium]
MICQGEQGEEFVVGDTIRPWCRDGDPTPDSHPEDTGGRRMEVELPQQPGPYNARLRLTNRYGIVSEKRIPFYVAGELAHSGPRVCDLGAACPLQAFNAEVQRFRAAMERCDRLTRSYAERLQAGNFVASVVKWLAENPERAGSKWAGLKDYSEEELWARLLGRNQQGEASSWPFTWLEQDLGDMERGRQEALREREAAARRLTSYLDEEFSPHLHDERYEHGAALEEDLPRLLNEAAVGLPETEHGAEWLSAKGAAFLEATGGPEPDKARFVLERAGRERIQPALWTWSFAFAMVKLAKGTYDANNDVRVKVGQAFVARLELKRARKALTTFDALLTDFELGRCAQLMEDVHHGTAQQFLDEVERRAKSFGGRHLEILALSKEGRLTPEALDLEYKRGADGAGAWDALGVLLDAFSVAIAALKLGEKWGQANSKELAGLAADSLALIKTLSEVSLKEQASLSGTQLSKGARTTLRVMGAAAAVASGVVSAFEAVDAGKKGQTGVMYGHLISLTASCVSVVGFALGGFAGAALTGIGAVVAIVGAVWVVFTTDAPVVDWLETCPWGVSRDMAFSEVIGNFYALQWSVHVSMQRDPADLGLDWLEFKLNKSAVGHRFALTLNTPSGRSLGTRRVYPGDPRRIEGLEPSQS